ncbi:MAG TPA: CHAD domain-containing protein [Casimicrobiaceae bacterium]|nr:CHAD domain-containing protein [Casimicrobiaceae bacterium]
MPTEVELKLSATPAAFAAVRRHRALTEANAGRARSAVIVSRYYDTPTHELHQRGIALRLRRRGARWLQTVKAGGDAVSGMHRRSEYEWPLSRASLDPARLAETPWAELFVETSGRMAPVFTTEVTRTERALKFGDGTRATLSFDQGAVRAGRKRSPLCEIEIELVEGDARCLYDLALALCADIPLMLAHASKADQGYVLAASRPMAPVRAGKVVLPPDVAVPQALAAIATDCLGQIGGNAEALRSGRDGEFLHQLRVGVRRLRSLLKLAAGTQAAADVASINRGLAGLSQVFGPARDWDVFATGTLAAIAPHLDDKERRGFHRLRLRASRKRRFHHAATQAEAGSQRFTCLLLELGRFRIGLELAAPDAPATAFARDALGRSERRLRKRGKRLREADAAGRHRVRVAAKKLRYAAEFFAPLFRHAGAKDYVDALAQLQTTLGHLNDMAAAARLVDELLAPARDDIELSRAAGIVRGWAAAISASELARLPKSWRQFAKARPFWN